MERRSTRSGTPLPRIIACIIAMCWPVAALAHTDDSATGFMSGLLHPILGLDHFLAMMSVGIVSAQLGGRNIWLVPAIFVTAMVMGATVGIYGIEWPLAETGIAASVLLLGTAVVVVKQGSNVLLIMMVTALFGSLHGHAHGMEMPRAADPVFYAGGFLAGTTAIHILGVAIGYFLTTRHDFVRWLRWLGGAIATVGAVFLFRLAG